LVRNAQIRLKLDFAFPAKGWFNTPQCGAKSLGERQQNAIFASANASNARFAPVQAYRGIS
jgi:hypothetical protein